MSTWILENSLLTCGVMLVIFGLCRLNRRRPALCHFLWVLAFVSLVMPPIPMSFTPGTLMRSELTAWLRPEEAVATPVEDSLPIVGLDTVGLAGTTAPAAQVMLATEELAVVQTSRVSDALSSITTLQGIVGLWLLGALAFIGFSAWRILRFHRRVRSALYAPDDLRAAVERVAQRLGVQAPAIRLLEGIGSPAIWCFGQPLLLWPSQDGEAVRHVGEPPLIAHELAHLARRDHWVSRLDVAAIGFCWWNPLFWVIRREIRYYAELSCDAWALWAYPTGRRVFAEALIDSQERTEISPVAIEGLCATHHEFKNFERRLTMIMSKNVSRQVSKGAATAALLTTILVLPGFSVQEKSCEGDKASASCDGAAAQCIDELVEAKQLANQAEKLFGAKEYGDAIATYQDVLVLDPRNGKAHGRIGYMLIGQGEYKQASKHFKAQVKLGHEVSTGVYNLACAASLGGDSERGLALLEQSVRRGFINSALMAEDKDIASLREHEGYTKALKLSKKSEWLRSQEKELLTEKDSEGLVKLYHSLGDIATEDGEVQDRCGLAFLIAKDYAAGLQAFERQAAVGHDVGRANYNMACAHALLGDKDKAVVAIERAAKVGMTYAAVLEDVDLASLRGEARFQMAAEQLMAQKVLKKKYSGAMAAGDLKQAAYSLNMILEDEQATAERQAWAAFELGRLQLKAEKAEASIANFQRAAQTGYSPASSAFYIGSAHASLGDYDAALSYYDKSLVLGYAEPKSMAKAVEVCGMSDTDEGRELVKRASYQWEKKEKKAKYGKKSSTDEWSDASKKKKAKPSPSLESTSNQQL